MEYGFPHLSVLPHSELLGTKGLLPPLQIAITAAVGYDSYLVMRHGARPGIRSGAMDDVIAQIQNLSTEDALGRQRLGCCFCNKKTSLFNVYYRKTYICGNFLLLILFYTYNFDTSSLISDLHDCIVLQSVSDETGALPGLTSIASGKAVELFARMLHHPEG